MLPNVIPSDNKLYKVALSEYILYKVLLKVINMLPNVVLSDTKVI